MKELLQPLIERGMKNPKTSIVGMLMLLAALSSIWVSAEVAHKFELTATAIGAASLFAAKD